MRLHLRSNSTYFQCWVYGFQFQEALRNARCQIKFFGAESVTYEGPIISAETEASQIEKEGRGLITFVKRNSANQQNINIVAKILDP